MKIANVPKVAGQSTGFTSTPVFVELDGKRYNHQTLKTVLDQAASAPAGTTYSIDLQPEADVEAKTSDPGNGVATVSATPATSA